MIIAARRSGSSHLVNTLGGHPEITCHGNVFAPGMLPVFWPKNHTESQEEIAAIKAELHKLRDSKPWAFLERVFATNHGRPCTGFKIFPRQNDKILKRIIKDSSVRKVVLLRGNVLARYSSQLAARESGQWGGRKQRDEGTKKVQFDTREFMQFCDNHMDYYSDVLNRLVTRREPYFLIRYEDINEPLMLRSLVRFIGANPNSAIVESEQRKVQVKQRTSDIVSRFENSDDVREFLAKHNMLGWAYEAETSMLPPFSDHRAERAHAKTANPEDNGIAPGVEADNEEGQMDA